MFTGTITVYQLTVASPGMVRDDSTDGNVMTILSGGQIFGTLDQAKAAALEEFQSMYDDETMTLEWSTPDTAGTIEAYEPSDDADEHYTYRIQTHVVAI